MLRNRRARPRQQARHQAAREQGRGKRHSCHSSVTLWFPTVLWFFVFVQILPVPAYTHVKLWWTIFWDCTWRLLHLRRWNSKLNSSRLTNAKYYYKQVQYRQTLHYNWKHIHQQWTSDQLTGLFKFPTHMDSKFLLNWYARYKLVINSGHMCIHWLAILSIAWL